MRSSHIFELHSTYFHWVDLWPRPPYAGEIWKLSFISTVRPTVRTNSSRKRNFSKTLFKPEEFENSRFAFSVDEQHSENGAFRKRLRHDNHVISLPEISSNTNPKWPVIVAFSNFSEVVWTEIIRCVFRGKTPFSTFSGVVWTGPERHNNLIAYFIFTSLLSTLMIFFLSLELERQYREETRRIEEQRWAEILFVKFGPANLTWLVTNVIEKFLELWLTNSGITSFLCKVPFCKFLKTCWCRINL